MSIIAENAQPRQAAREHMAYVYVAIAFRCMKHAKHMHSVYTGRWRGHYLSARIAAVELARAFYFCQDSYPRVKDMLATAPLIYQNGLETSMDAIVADAAPVHIGVTATNCLLFLYRYRGAFRTADIARAVAAEPSNAHGSLAVLVRQGLVTRDGKLYQYKTGPRADRYCRYCLQQKETPCSSSSSKTALEQSSKTEAGSNIYMFSVLYQQSDPKCHFAREITRISGSVGKEETIMDAYYDTELALTSFCGEGTITGDGEFVASCPNPGHPDSTPSFGYNLGSDLFNCLGCDLHGRGLRSLVQQIFMVRELEIGQILYPFKAGGSGNLTKDHYEHLAKMKQARTDAAYLTGLNMARQLWDGRYDKPYTGRVCTEWKEPYTQAQEYLLGRKFTPAALNYFHVHTWEFAKSHQLYIPLTWNGEVFGYTRRATHDRLRNKYLTMEGLDTSKYVFGEYVEGQPFLLVEGPLDWMKSRQRGVLSGGSVLSNNLSDAQADIIAGVTDVVVVGSDMDRGGEILYQRALEKFGKRGVKVVRMIFSMGDVCSIKKLEFQFAWEDALEQAGLLVHAS